MNATVNKSEIFLDECRLKTRGELDVVDITKEVHRLVRKSGLKNGGVHIFVPGSTASLTTIEFEPGAVADLKDMVSRIVPRDIQYAHNERWGDGNGHSHVRAALLGPDLTVPFRGGAVSLGTWQQIILVEFDTRGRNRNVHVTILGEGGLKEGVNEN